MDSLQDSPEAYGISYDAAKKLSIEDWKTLASGTDGTIFLIAYINNIALGVIGGTFLEGEFELVSMWVNPSARGKKMGISLVNSLLSHAALQGYSKVVLHVLADNFPAYSLYKQCGFFVTVDELLYNSYNDDNLQKMLWYHAPLSKSKFKREYIVL